MKRGATGEGGMSSAADESRNGVRNLAEAAAAGARAEPEGTGRAHWLRGSDAGQDRGRRAQAVAQVAELLAAQFGVPPAEWAAFAEFARADLPPHRAPALLDPGAPAPWRALHRPPTNLPAPPTAFIGRAQTVDQAGRMLRSPGVRLLTLTGPPGIGKTRTALQVAGALLADFADGVFFVPLAPIRDPALLVPAVAEALDLRERNDQSLLRDGQRAPGPPPAAPRARQSRTGDRGGAARSRSCWKPGRRSRCC